MRIKFFICLFFASSMACAGASPTLHDTSLSTSELEARGELVFIEKKESYTIDEVKALLADFSDSLVEQAIYPVDVYRVTYQTIGTNEKIVWASGTLALPVGAADGVPILSYQHGTAVYRFYSSTSQEILLVPLVFATSGYAAAAPDYLGLEKSGGLHPFLHAESLATAVVDMLRATRHACKNGILALDGRVFLAGYSEGGYATLAAQRLIESNHADEFELVASAPMAGPYDLSSTATTILSKDSFDNPYYLPYLILAYNHVYNLYGSLNAIFQDDIAEDLPTLFDGLHVRTEINAALPLRPRDMFQPSFLDDFDNNPKNKLRLALEKNNLYAWAPKTKTHLYHCVNDTVVPYENSAIAYAHFVDLGATDVTLIPSAGSDHGQCAFPILYEAKLWFDDVKEAE